MQVAPFHDIVKILIRKYRKAIKISNSHVGTLNIGYAQELSDINRRKKIKTRQMVYLDESPDYCVPDVATGKCRIESDTGKSNENNHKQF